MVKKSLDGNALAWERSKVTLINLNNFHICVGSSGTTQAHNLPFNTLETTYLNRSLQIKAQLT